MALRFLARPQCDRLLFSFPLKLHFPVSMFGNYSEREQGVVTETKPVLRAQALLFFFFFEVCSPAI